MGSSDDSIARRLRWILEGAERMVEEERERVRQEARHQAYEEVLGSVLLKAEEWEERARRLEREVSDRVVEVVLSVVSEILDEEYSDRERVMDSVRRAMGALVWHPKVRIVVSPQGREVLSSRWDEISPALHGVVVSVEEDPSLRAGECIVESDTHAVMITVEEFIARLRQWYERHRS